MNLESVECARCENGFEPKAKIVNCNGELFCSGCFVCAQCFRPFPDGVFYEFEERKYCEHCFHVLYAPCCAKCGEFIIGRVIKVSVFGINDTTFFIYPYLNGPFIGNATDMASWVLHMRDVSQRAGRFRIYQESRKSFMSWLQRKGKIKQIGNLI